MLITLLMWFPTSRKKFLIERVRALVKQLSNELRRWLDFLVFFPNSRSFFFLEIIHINGSLQCLSEKVHNELTINVLLGMKLTTTFLKSGEQTSLLFQFDVILSVILIIPSVNHNPVVDPCSYFWKLDHSNFFFAE